MKNLLGLLMVASMGMSLSMQASATDLNSYSDGGDVECSVGDKRKLKKKILKQEKILALEQEKLIEKQNELKENDEKIAEANERIKGLEGKELIQAQKELRILRENEIELEDALYDILEIVTEIKRVIEQYQVELKNLKGKC